VVVVAPPRVIFSALREVPLVESAMASGGYQPAVIGANGFHSSLAMRPATDGCTVTVVDRRRMPVRVKLYRHAFSRCHACNFAVLVLFHRAAIGLYRPRATVGQRVCSRLIVDAIRVLVGWAAHSRPPAIHRVVSGYLCIRAGLAARYVRRDDPDGSFIGWRGWLRSWSRVISIVRIAIGIGVIRAARASRCPVGACIRTRARPVIRTVRSRVIPISRTSAPRFAVVSP
jgi:hypothetical protein